MKKFILGVAAALLVCAASCTSCEKKSDVKNDTVSVSGDMVVENVVNTDKQYMFTNYGKGYRWFETCVVLKDYLDSEGCDGTINSVSSVFQVVEEHGQSADVHVVMMTHGGDSTQIDVQRGFWVEDYPMNDETIKITFKEAFEKVMATNATKPHSRQAVLRKEVGAVDCNPQYIFGNTRAQLYVDAVTGDVRTSNPAFPEGFKMPLGEWP